MKTNDKTIFAAPTQDPREEERKRQERERQQKKPMQEPGQTGRRPEEKR